MRKMVIALDGTEVDATEILRPAQKAALVDRQGAAAQALFDAGGEDVHVGYVPERGEVKAIDLVASFFAEAAEAGGGPRVDALRRVEAQVPAVVFEPE
jgi:hypothetical protein